MRRPLLLNGFMGTGKTTVGKLVAERSGRSFVDLDAEVEQASGKSVAEIFATGGEAAFRGLEGEALRRALAREDAPVVALGGGALLRRPVRLDAVDRAVVVTLTASPEDVLRRAGGGPPRPLLAGPDPEARILALLEDRGRGYAECHAAVGTSGRKPGAVADDVLAVWRRDPLAVADGEDSYAVDVGRGVASGRLPALVAGASLTVLVTDRNVHAHHGQAIERELVRSGKKTATVVLEPGEEHKHTPSLERIWDAALAAGADRKSVFVAVGGGVVTDVAGFAAATWMRGVRWIGFPTTLLAMVDASVGGKTAVDLGSAKNAIGAFWQPSGVVCDVEHLSTEPLPGYVSALAEVVKTAIVGDPELFELLERNAAAACERDLDLAAELVRRSVRVKARVVSADPREDGIRAWLNLGHTVGHALEAHGGYGHLRHGEAVSLGLVAALRVGERLGVTDPALVERGVAALRVLGLPVDSASRPLAAAVELIGHDKKRAGTRLKFIAARAVGQVEIVDLGLAELRGHVVALAS